MTTHNLQAPFSQQHPIRSLADILAVEQTPLAQALPVRSTYEIIRNSAHAFGDRPALSFLTVADPAVPPITWTYGALLGQVHQFANLLHTLGVGPQDAVAVLLPGCLEYHLALWGGEAAGIVLPLNPLLSDEKLVALMSVARAKVLVAYGAEADSGLWSKALRIRGQVPTLQTVLRVAPHDETQVPELPAGVLNLAPALAAQPAEALLSGRDIAPSDIAAYFHTGGTTGAPKLARHSHGAQVFTAWASVQVQGIRPDDTGINGYPLFHVAGVLPGALASLSAGAHSIIPTTALMRNREVVRNYWRLVEAYRVTTISAVPTVLAALAGVPLGGANIHTVRTVRTGAAPLPAELSARFRELYALQAHESFGMTETAGIASITPPGVTAPAGCVGFPVPHARVRIAVLGADGHPTSEDTAPGEPGVILYQAPNVFSGYLDPADNARAFTAEGWLNTGDVGFVDAEGRLHISGRAKDLIIRSGHNIDPKVIEDAVAAHPAVQYCAAVGAPDAYAGELPVVYVTLKPGQSATPEELLAFAAARVDEAPARPKAITVIETMPMTNVGKIFKPDLRALATRSVIEQLAAQCATVAGLPAAPGLSIEADARGGWTVGLADPAPAAYADALARELERLPAKARLLRS